MSFAHCCPESRKKGLQKYRDDMGFVHWTPELDLILESFYADKIKFKHIAYLMNMSKASVTHRIYKLKLSLKYNRGFRFTPELDDYIRANYAHSSASEIADHLNLTYSQVYRRAWRLGLAGYKVGENHPDSKVTDEDVELCRKLYDEGLRISVIAEKMELSNTYVHHICHFRMRKYDTPKCHL